MVKTGFDEAGAYIPGSERVRQSADSRFPDEQEERMEFKMKCFITTMMIIGLILAPAAAMAAQVAPTNNPVSAYLFDEGSGASTADAFGSNPGTLNGNATWTNTTPFSYAGNNAVLYNGGTPGYCTLGAPADLNFLAGTDEFTIAGWYYNPGGTSDNAGTVIATKGGDPNGSVQYELATLNWPPVGLWTSIRGGTAPTGGFTPGPIPNWYHLAVVVGPANCQAYVNGSAQGGTFAWGSASTPTDPVWIGGQYSVGNPGSPINWYSAGGSLIDEVGFWNVALSADNIEWLANNSIKDLLGGAATPGTLIYGK